MRTIFERERSSTSMPARPESAAARATPVVVADDGG
jgi:hypothetical protein